MMSPIVDPERSCRAVCVDHSESDVFGWSCDLVLRVALMIREGGLLSIAERIPVAPTIEANASMMALRMTLRP